MLKLVSPFLSLWFTSAPSRIKRSASPRCLLQVIENGNKKYFPLFPFNGFSSFLAAEYHRLGVGAKKKTIIEFTDNSPDSDIRHQRIMRTKTNEIIVISLFEDGTVYDEVDLGLLAGINEIVFVAYTINANPYYSGGPGRIFSVSIRARTR